MSHALRTMTATGHFQVLTELLSKLEATEQAGTALSLDQAAAQAVQAIVDVARTSNKIMLIGNGGSAAIVGHMQNDLSKAVGVRAMTFTEPSLMTALSNDEGYGSVFEHPIRLWANPGDLLIAVSSSGRSENILRGVRACHARGGRTITLSGFKADNPLRKLGVVNFYVPSEVYGHVESVHGVLTHLLTDHAMQAWSMLKAGA